MNDYQLVLDAEDLLNRLKIPAIRDAYPVCRLYPAIIRAYRRYARRFYVHHLTVPSFPADAGRFPVSGSLTQSAGMGQGGTKTFYQCPACSRLTPFSIQWGFAIRECASCGFYSDAGINDKKIGLLTSKNANEEGGAQATNDEAAFLKSPHTITSGLLSHGETF